MKPKKTLETGTIANLVLGLIVGQIVEPLQDQYLEHEQGVNRLATSVALALPFTNDAKAVAEYFPIDDRVETYERIAKFGEVRSLSAIIAESRTAANLERITSLLTHPSILPKAASSAKRYRRIYRGAINTAVDSVSYQLA